MSKNPITQKDGPVLLNTGRWTQVKNNKVYISGPITGIEDLNKPAFEEAEKTLNGRGNIPVNPHKLHQKPETWEGYMVTDIKHLLECGSVVMLSGWENSVGAVFEFLTAKTLNIPVFDMDFNVTSLKHEQYQEIFEKVISKIADHSIQNELNSKKF